MNFEPTIKDFTPDQMRYIASLVESTMTAAVLAEREEIASWYEDTGYLLDESDVADAIRAKGE